MKEKLININLLYRVFLKNFLNKSKFSDSEEKAISIAVDKLRLVFDWSNYYIYKSDDSNLDIFNYGFPSKARKKSNTYCVSSAISDAGSMGDSDMVAFSSYLKSFILLATSAFASKVSLSNFLGENGILVFLKTPNVGITKATTNRYLEAIADGVQFGVVENKKMLVVFHSSNSSPSNIFGRYLIKPLDNYSELSIIRCYADCGNFTSLSYVFPSQAFGRTEEDKEFAFLIFATGKPLAYKVRITDRWDMECEEFSNFATSDCKGKYGNADVDIAIMQGYNYMVKIANEDGFSSLTSYYMSLEDFKTLAEIESGLDPCAFPKTGEKSFGLYQVYLPTFQRIMSTNERAKKEFGNITPKDLFNPYINAKFAAILMLENYKTLCSAGVIRCKGDSLSNKYRGLSALFCAWNSGVNWVISNSSFSDDFVYCCHSKKLCERGKLGGCRDKIENFSEACRKIMNIVAGKWGIGAG